MKMTQVLKAGIVAFVIIALPQPPAWAGYKLISAGSSSVVAVAGSPRSIVVTPSSPWNSLNGTLTGKYVQSWTIDGASLNDLRFYVGVPNDVPLFREISKSKKPLPHFNATMLAPDVAQLLEESYRVATDTSLFKIDTIEPAQLGGFPAFRFSFSYTLQEEEVRRKGEATGAIVDGRLYMITYAAPALHYYDQGYASYRAVVDSARLGTVVTRRRR